MGFAIRGAKGDPLEITKKTVGSDDAMAPFDEGPFSNNFGDIARPQEGCKPPSVFPGTLDVITKSRPRGLPGELNVTDFDGSL